VIEVSSVNSSPSIQIPNKSLFKSDEVCGLTGVKPYVLRFWETEFEEISPVLSEAGQKLYEHKDIEAIVVVKRMLFDEKMNIEKAKSEIKIRLHHTMSEHEQEGEVIISRRALVEEEVTRLSEAREMLSHLVARAEELRQRHHWL
jgi:DNA-binding transcriptional MerR regulator